MSMFNLDQVCPGCGAPAREIGVETSTDGQILNHVNGGQWNYIRFTCGREDKYIPNFLKVVTEHQCRFRPEAVQERTVRQKYLNDVLAAANKFDVDDKFRTLAQEAIDRLRYHID